MVDVIQRIRQLNQARHWSEYRLAKEAGLSQSTISNLMARGNSPTLFTLERICKAYGITLAQFFCGCDRPDNPELAEELYHLSNLYQQLSPYQRKEVIHYMDDMQGGMPSLH